MGSIQEPSRKGYVVAGINYFPSLGTPIPTFAWQRRYLGVRDEHTKDMIIHDVRQSRRSFDLDINGFKFLKLSLKQRVSSSSPEEVIRQEYYPELEDLARTL